MSSQITTAFTQQYSNNVKLLAQEKGSQLRNTVNVESVIGKNSFFDQKYALVVDLKNLL